MSEDKKKRKVSDLDGAAAEEPKRTRAGEEGGQDLVEYNDGSGGRSQAIIVSEGGIRRKSTLLGPTMLLEGHQAAVHSIKFNPDGSTLATASFDKTINLWNVRGENENFMMLEGHKNAVLDIAYSSDGLYLASCSADKVVGLWDAEVRAYMASS
jgi:Prp8 binding protein